MKLTVSIECATLLTIDELPLWAKSTSSADVFVGLQLAESVDHERLLLETETQESSKYDISKKQEINTMLLTCLFYETDSTRFIFQN